MPGSDDSSYLTEVAVEPGDVELVLWRLWSHLPPPGSVEEVATPSGAIVLRAGAHSGEHAESMAAALRPRWVPRIVKLGARAVRAATDRWKEGSSAIRVGDIDVRPSWVRRTEPGAIEVVLDTSNSFGIGSHPTTQMLLGMLQRAGIAGAHVLDIGCGTGVLSIAAAKLGARRVVAIDIDVEAVATASANILRNDVDDIVAVSATPLDKVDGSYDIIAANLSAATLTELADVIRCRARPGAALLLSGVLADQEPQVVEAFAGCDVVERADGDGWVAVTLRCP